MEGKPKNETLETPWNSEECKRIKVLQVYAKNVKINNYLLFVLRNHQHGHEMDTHDAFDRLKSGLRAD